VDEASVAIVKGLGAKAAVVWLLALVNDSLVQRHERANLISNRLESSWTGGVLQQRRVNPRGIRHG